jgi:hypothetical protein
MTGAATNGIASDMAVATARIRNDLWCRIRLSSPGSNALSNVDDRERDPSVLCAGHLPDLVRELPVMCGA